MDTFLREEKRKYDTNEMVLGISQKVPKVIASMVWANGANWAA